MKYHDPEIYNKFPGKIPFQPGDMVVRTAEQINEYSTRYFALWTSDSKQYNAGKNDMFLFLGVKEKEYSNPKKYDSSDPFVGPGLIFWLLHKDKIVYIILALKTNSILVPEFFPLEMVQKCQK